MASVTPQPPAAPSSEELQRELAQVRAAQPRDPPVPPQERTVGALLLRRGLRVLGLWFVLVLVFLAIWQFLVPSGAPQRPPPARSSQ